MILLRSFFIYIYLYLPLHCKAVIVLISCLGLWPASLFYILIRSALTYFFLAQPATYILPLTTIKSLVCLLGSCFGNSRFGFFSFFFTLLDTTILADRFVGLVFFFSSHDGYDLFLDQGFFLV